LTIPPWPARPLSAPRATSQCSAHGRDRAPLLPEAGGAAQLQVGPPNARPCSAWPSRPPAPPPTNCRCRPALLSPGRCSCLGRCWCPQRGARHAAEAVQLEHAEHPCAQKAGVPGDARRRGGRLLGHARCGAAGWRGARRWVGARGGSPGQPRGRELAAAPTGRTDRPGLGVAGCAGAIERALQLVKVKIAGYTGQPMELT
jgi:hypothetical protein